MSTPIDLHIHSSFSDGTDTPAELLEKVRAAKLEYFSLTDHDTQDGCRVLQSLVRPEDGFISGIELTCRTAFRKCHILGYNYRIGDDAMEQITRKLTDLRKQKLTNRLAALKDEFSISFTQQEEDELLAMESPGKVHIARLLVKYNYADSIDEAIKNYLNKLKIPKVSIDAAEAIRAIKQAGGVAVWAHPLGGEGETHLTPDDFYRQFDLLLQAGIEGLECYYSRYDAREASFLVSVAKENNLHITAGSDYHGKNKTISLGGFWL